MFLPLFYYVFTRVCLPLTTTDKLLVSNMNELPSIESFYDVFDVFHHNSDPSSMETPSQLLGDLKKL